MSTEIKFQKGMEVNCNFDQFLYSHQVLPSEIDQFKVVHYSRYYEWISACLLNLLSNVNVDIFNNKYNFEIRVAKVQAAYLSSAKINDVVNVVIHRMILFEKYMHVYFRLKNNSGKVLMRANLVVACVDSSGELTEIPDHVINNLINISNKKDV